MPDSPASASGRTARTPRLRSRGFRRSASQAGLVAALLAVFTVCATTAGTCALLMTAGNARALSAAVAQVDGTADSGSADLTTVLLTSSPLASDGSGQANAATLVPVTRRALLEAARPYHAQVSLWATTPLLLFAGKDRKCGYLVDADSLAANAALRSGSWPDAPSTSRGAIGVAIPTTTAAALGASVGTTFRLSQDRHNGEPVEPVFDLLVTGTFDPSGTPAWGQDSLRGRGYLPDYLGCPTFGPFVTSSGALVARAAPLQRLAALMDPDLAGDADDVPALLAGLGGVADQIEDAAGSTINPVFVSSPLGPAFDGMRAELSLSNSLVLAVFLIVLALCVATASLVARVLVGRRSGEVTLLRDRGASTRQLVSSSAIEALALAAAAALIAAPVSLPVYAATAPAPVGSEASPGLWAPLGFGLVAALLAGAALPAVVVLIAALPERQRRGRQVISGVVARSGVDVILALLAAVAYVQLRSHVVSSGTVDPLLVVAPAVCALAVAALVTRLLAVLARAADAAASRSRGIVLPMAGWHLARGGAAQGAFLLVLAAAVATLSVTFLGTWSTSQGDQAAAKVGADLVVAQPGGPGTARELMDATGGAVTPVADSAVVLGSRPGGVKVLAIDSSLADQMMRGRLPDTTWSSEMAGLAPTDGGAPLTIPGGPFRITLTGGMTPSSVGAGMEAPVLSASPSVVLTDEAGFQTTLVGSEVALDGRPHGMSFPLSGQQPLPAGTWQVVAIDLLLGDHSGEDLSSWGTTSAAAEVSVSIEGASSAGGPWDASASRGQGVVQPGDVAVHAGTVDAAFSYNVLELSWQDAHLTLLSFPASTQVPVAMSEGLGTELGLAAGDRMAMTWGTAAVEVVLVRTVPFVPSHVREAALLTDLTSLRRALLTTGMVDPVTDLWWVSSPRAGAAEALREAGKGPVSTGEEATTQLRDGPLRTSLPVAWLLAIAAAVGLAVTGSAAHAAAEAQRRAATIARVRAIGMSTRDALASHLLQHAVITVTAVALGTASGAFLSWLLAPLLVVDPLGQRAIPSAVLVWSAGPAAAVVGAILVGALLAGVPAAIAVVRRSTVAALRAGEAP